ncbi:MAG TPA: hypothetical protein VMT85_18725 [Thermoanaerobaculia bacterium]|nr:hypothetical protein [Thermoanaerobaculia bacterium]
MHGALHGVGPAMIRTTLVVAVGLAPLMLARYLSVSMLGRELALVLLAALLVDLVAVPAAIVGLRAAASRGIADSDEWLRREMPADRE